MAQEFNLFLIATPSICHLSAVSPGGLQTKPRTQLSSWGLGGCNFYTRDLGRALDQDVLFEKLLVRPATSAVWKVDRRNWRNPTWTLNCVDSR